MMVMLRDVLMNPGVIRSAKKEKLEYINNTEKVGTISCEPTQSIT